MAKKGGRLPISAVLPFYPLLKPSSIMRTLLTCRYQDGFRRIEEGQGQERLDHLPRCRGKS
jgi:hypothetical protein